MSLLSISADAKTVKGEKQGYLTGILYLAPNTIAGIGNLCPDATAGCKAACLYTAGRGVFNYVQTARIARAKRFKADRTAFMAELVKDIAALVRKAKRAGMIPAARLNGTSDLPWESLDIIGRFPDVQFYDYTKSYRRMADSLGMSGKAWPANYYLTFSRSECNDTDAGIVLRNGGTVAVVFSTRKGEALPETWAGFAVIDGDVSDLRFLDRGLVIGLRSKGRARRDASGFVVAA